MKTIERKILEAFRARESVKLSSRDEVTSYNSGLPLYFVDYYLHGTRVARRDGRVLILGTPRGDWQTVTTKSRINAFAREYGLPGIVQKDFVWSWTDNIPYTGERYFSI